VSGAFPTYDALEGRFEEIWSCEPAGEEAGVTIGRSRAGRPVRAFRLGSGPLRVSLLAGCHADEPVGPALLRRLAAHLRDLPDGDPLLTAISWWILPHLDPDGEAANAAWQRPGGTEPAAYDPALYLAHVERAAPGDDVEFGFPRGEGDDGARPENRAAWAWWREAGPFALHASLHGMATGTGPWYLVEPGWLGRAALDGLLARCRASAAHAGFPLHDVERAGEKGFHRIDRGFATRPDHVAMREHFLAAGDPATAALFRPSSMESVRALGGDPLTLVSEVPLFRVPEDGDDAGAWRERLRERAAALRSGGADAGRVVGALEAAGLRPVPLVEQMRLVWAFVCAGLEAAAAGGTPAGADLPPAGADLPPGGAGRTPAASGREGR